ncbi:unnamed protein product, partial [marine sediment metagenome]
MPNGTDSKEYMFMQYMEAGETVLSRGLPKTGQTAVEQAGDDGFYQAGWWQGIKKARTRFIAKTIGDNGDDVVIDLATGLMWAADGGAAGCFNGGEHTWLECFTYLVDFEFAGFSDWRIPNVKELMSIVDNGRQNPAIKEPPFSLTRPVGYWTSTAFRPSIDEAWIVHFLEGVVTHKDKDTYYFHHRSHCC